MIGFLDLGFMNLPRDFKVRRPGKSKALLRVGLVSISLPPMKSTAQRTTPIAATTVKPSSAPFMFLVLSFVGSMLDVGAELAKTHIRSYR